MTILKSFSISLCLFISVCIPVFSQNNQVTDSQVSFRISNADIAANGRFEQIHPFIHFDPKRPLETKFNLKIEVESIKTGIRLRDQHLKRPGYFDVHLFPTIDIDLLTIKDAGNGSFTGEFKIRMKGTEKRMEIPFKMKEGSGKYTFESDFSLNRRDFKIGGKSWTLSDIVYVHVRFVVLPLGQ